GNVTLGSATLTTGNDNTSTTFSGVISGTGGLVKIGAGTLTLTGANSYTGPTIVSGGMLQVGNGGTVGNIGGNGSFGIDRSDTSTFGGVISVTGSFVKAGTGKVILTGSNTYQGGTVINAGTLAVSTDANLGQCFRWAHLRGRDATVSRRFHLQPWHDARCRRRCGRY